MKIKVYLIMLSVLMFVSVISGFAVGQKEQHQDKVQIMVSILPQTYFVEKIGGDKVIVSIMLPPGASPVTYEPRPGQMKELTRARMYVRIKVPFENAWMDKISAANRDMLIVDSTEGIERIGGKDPHIWLSPKLVKIQVENIYRGLVRVNPENKEIYTQNKKKFLKEIDVLNEELTQTLKSIKNRKFMVFHPSWSYFARDYGLEQIPIEIEGKEPSAAEMINLIKNAKSNNIKIIFVQPQFNSDSAETIAGQIDGKVMFVDPLAEDWANNLRVVAKTFTQR